jgi:hypothetical protein
MTGTETRSNNSELLAALSTFLGPYRGAPAAVLATS